MNQDEALEVLAEALRLAIRIEQAGRVYFTGSARPSGEGLKALEGSRAAAVAEQRKLLLRIAGESGVDALSARVAARQASLFESVDHLDRDRNHFIKAFRALHGRDSGDPGTQMEFQDRMQEFNDRKEELIREAAGRLIRTEA